MKTTYLLLALAAFLFCAVVAASADDGDRRRPDMHHWDDDDEGREWDDEWDDDEDGEERGRGQWDGEKGCHTTKKCRTTTKHCPTTTKHCPTTTKHCPTTTKHCPTTTKHCPTTTKHCPTTTKHCTTTEKPCTTTAKPVEKKCDFAGRDNCLKASEVKFEECVDRKKCAFTVCELEAEEKFKKCLRGRDGRDGGREYPFEREGENDRQGNERFEQCKKEKIEDKKQCLIQRKASHAGCVAAKECRDFKCLAFIKDCTPCPTPAVTTTTTAPPVGSSCPAEDFFGPAADLNVLVTGSDKLIYDFDMVNGDVEGRVAVNGGFRVKSFGTAQAYSCPDTANYANMFNLIVNGKMDYSNGQLFCGSSISLSSMNDPSLRQKDLGATNARVAAGKTIKDVTGFDFVATAGYLQGVSNYFSQYAPGKHSHFRVTQVSPADVNKLSIEAGDYVQVINIKGSGDINFSNFEIPTALNPSQVIYNVVGNNNIKISGFGLKGHLLALNSDVVLENGHIAGNVYVKSLVGQGSGQVNLAPCP